MKEEEKQRKFHEALLKMLYPPLSPRHEAEEEEEKKLIEPSNNHPSGEELENEERYSSPSRDDDDDDEGENGKNEKLTRAQRKRLRKRKLKEGACKRRKIIGPLLPDSSDLDKDDQVVGNVPESVRQNASTNVSSGDVASCSKRNKLRKRRKSNNLSGKS